MTELVPSVRRGRDAALERFGETRRIISEIQDLFAVLSRILEQAYVHEDWRELGYANPEEYVKAVRGDWKPALTRDQRREWVRELSAKEYPQRGIGAALGVGKDTVGRALANEPRVSNETRKINKQPKDDVVQGEVVEFSDPTPVFDAEEPAVGDVVLALQALENASDRQIYGATRQMGEARWRPLFTRMQLQVERIIAEGVN